MESVSLRLYSNAYPCHPNINDINVVTQIPLELYKTKIAKRVYLVRDNHIMTLSSNGICVSYVYMTLNSKHNL